MSTTSILIWILLAIVGLVLVAAAVGFFLYRAQAKRSLIRLVGHREAVRSAYRALEATFASLAQETPDEMLAFATLPDNVRRKALEELQERMALEVQDLQEMALPKKAWHAADLLMSAAQQMSDEIGKITTAGSPDAVLGAVAALDVGTMRSAMADAGGELDRVLRASNVRDASVYGGGLYI